MQFIHVYNPDTVTISYGEIYILIDYVYIITGVRQISRIHSSPVDRMSL